MTQESKPKGARTFGASVKQNKQKKLKQLVALVDADYKTYKLQFELHENHLVAVTLLRLQTEINELREMLLADD